MIFRVHTLVRSFTLNGRASKVSLTSPNPEIQCNGVAIPKYSQTQTIATGMVFFFSEQGPECGQGYVMKMARGKKKKNQTTTSVTSVLLRGFSTWNLSTKATEANCWGQRWQRFDATPRTVNILQKFIHQHLNIVSCSCCVDPPITPPFCKQSSSIILGPQRNKSVSMLGGCPTSKASTKRPTSHKDSQTRLLPALCKTVMHKHDM